MIDDSWRAKWQAAQDAVGQDLSDGATRWGADRIEAAVVRRYVEPLEIGTLIHTEKEAAVAAGYPGLVAPATGALAFSLPAMWSPGEETLWKSSERNAQPARTPINNEDPGPIPRTEGFFATDIEADFLRPVEIGERVGTKGRHLLSCVLKETSVGRGAFMTVESQIVSDRGDTVARLRTTLFAFDPIPEERMSEHVEAGANG
ncbi:MULTISPECIES: MaoC family dehydratase N-terminal domain-containing protein [unclassified Rhodococcus (in: high G+C Gram-positive bacteria)]|uniref:FAS1-like dehydratase domain-containing protein n=1 Tax=unclassified Rhodococcus (in: high G+C Gram-positive bacteria) TaxID=192944 RepID=UPI00163B2B76|nr:MULTISPECIES: MaoC family dehydratase N-terminal domain-containing protein [unclassified Rhodococcus (in: high G+C Gram-positive bacteria)]MBC2644592.1 MaoC family dehydratase N-terminal domain-containing protein [Rhodococcus sp. 3A]MBC2890964.1 MaoC family dehydratase N-terminal domain-containing protein [Rhodococcus sp. 4CII]MBC2897691.1 MaoC family dehydratase N-terminal domain-containing protein [Rhodococcus sp. 4CII]